MAAVSDEGAQLAWTDYLGLASGKAGSHIVAFLELSTMLLFLLHLTTR